MSRILSLTRWGVILLLSGAYGIAGVMILMGKFTPQFLAWGYPGWFVYIIGVLEIGGAVGLYHHKSYGTSTLLLAVIGAGAVLTHVGHHEGLVAPLPAIFLLLTSFALMYLNAKHRASLPV